MVAARSLYVAFCDDDSWWAPGSLQLAEVALDAHPQLALVSARTLVGPRQVPDPLTASLASSPLPRSPDAPGPSVFGFLACSAVLRRRAFCEVGGFNRILFFMGEEQVLCYDLGGFSRSGTENRGYCHIC